MAPDAQAFLRRQMEDCLFGSGAEAPPGYVPPSRGEGDKPQRRLNMRKRPWVAVFVASGCGDDGGMESEAESEAESESEAEGECGEFGAPAQLSQPEGSVAEHEVDALFRGDDLYVAYMANQPDGSPEVVVARSRAGGPFEMLYRTAGPGVGSWAYDPRLAVGPSGQVYLAYIAAGLGIFAVATDGESFSQEAAVHDPSAHSDWPWIAVGSDGTVYVSYRYSSTGGDINEVAVFRSVSGGNDFEGPIIVATSPPDVYIAQVSVALDGAEALLVAWTQVPAKYWKKGIPLSGEDVWVARAAAWPDFAAPVRVSDPAGSASSGAQPIVLATDNRIHVAYTQAALEGKDVRLELVVADSTDGGESFQPPVAVYPWEPNTAPAFQRFANDQSGALHAVWTRAKAPMLVLGAEVEIDVLYSASPAGAPAFGPAQSVSGKPYNLVLDPGGPMEFNPPSWIGDYQTVAVGPAGVAVLYADARTGNAHLMCAQEPLEAP